MLGPYEIVSLLGAGGMGEVYRARDTRLQRTVAVKVLPPGLHADEKLRARFDREARAISSLSHPNICTLFDVGHADGIDYLVMEHLEGESLAERLAGGPLPGSLVLRYGAQIAEGLQQAHRAGITHRDLKPGNIMITNAGAKILDFGLAKFMEPERLFSDESAPDTIVRNLTEEGAIVGTTAYMSPEQLQGKPLDARTDIFSLGVVLYEMATGQRPFPSSSKAACVAAILSSDPVPIRSLQPAITPALERIIVTALEKNPEDRWQTAHDVGRQLRWLSESSSTSEPSPAVLPRHRVPTAGLVAAAALLAALLGWLGARFLSPAHTRTAPVSLMFAQPAGLQPSYSPELNVFVISPDGRSIVFVATSAKTRELYLRRLDSFAVTKIAGSENAVSPFWSSDGQWIGFSAGGRMWKTRIGGDTPPQAICEVNPNGTRASWQGDTILFGNSRGERRAIYRVEASGGKPVSVTKLQRGESVHTWPLLLPDGQHFLYQALHQGSMEKTLYLAALDDPSVRVALTRNSSFARLAGPGRLVYVRDGSLLSQRFNLKTGESRGDPELVAADVSYFYSTGRADFDASPGGAILYRTETSTGRLMIMDRKGAITRTIDDQNRFLDHDLSPDGKKAVVTVKAKGTGLMDLWIYDLARGVRERFTSDDANEFAPSWSPDSRSIVYSGTDGGTFPHLVRRGLSGSGHEELTPRGSFQSSAEFTADGQSVYYADNSGRGTDILKYTPATKSTKPFLATKFNEDEPAVSRDGRWLAYSSDTTGAREVYLQSLVLTELEPIRISTAGGSLPKWRADAKELFFIGPDNMVVSAVPESGERWDAVTLSNLFQTPDQFRHFVAAPDGQSFVIATERKGAADEFMHVILGGT